jgi:hypothetical protein
LIELSKKIQESSDENAKYCCSVWVASDVDVGWWLTYHRVGREWEVNDSQADEDHTSERLYGRGAIDVSDDNL